MNPQILEVYIEVAVMLGNLKEPSYEDLKDALNRYCQIEVTIQELENFFLPETQDKLAQMKSWGINY